MLDDSYSKDELKEISSFFFTEKSDICDCRDKLSFLLSHTMLHPNQTTLCMKFADFFL